jgi:hypothetical protein
MADRVRTWRVRLPLSVPVESPAGRLELRRIMSDIGYLYLALRLGCPIRR